ncbi:MAG: pitrilysin family protein [Acutalibacteraceae bacterium]|nr:pitrilysin family protein [Acutalibacteraceae bacterium]
MKKEILKSRFGESYVKYVHPTGLKVFVCEKPDYSSSYAVFGTKYGSIDTFFSKDGGNNFVSVPEGIAHFLEHKLFESEDGDAFSRYAVTGANANAYTSFDRTCYLFSCSDKFYDNLEILLDFVQHPYFTAKTVEKEQGIIGQEIRMYDDSPSWRVLFNMLEAMYEKHPVRIDIAGTVESIAEITDGLLYECYNTFYNPSNMFVCVAGNVKADEIYEFVNSHLLKTQPVEIVRGTFEEGKNVRKKYTEQSLEVASPLFCLGFKEECDNRGKSLEEKTAMEVTLEVLAGDCSPLYKRLTDLELINDEFDTEYFTSTGYACVMFSGESENPKAVKEEIVKEIARLLENGIDAKLLETVKKAMYGDVIRRFNSTENIVSQMIECAMFDFDMFCESELIAGVTEQSVKECLMKLYEEKSVLSVISPK